MANSAAVDTEDAWADLLRQAEGASDRTLLENLLRAVCEGASVSGAALYLEGDSGFERHLAVGRPEFPERLPEELGELVDAV